MESKPLDIDRIFNAIRDSNTAVIDTETDGLDWKVNKIVGYVVTVGPRDEDSFYIPIRHESGPNIDPAMIAERFNKEVFNRPDLRVVGHHMKFDAHMLMNEGICINTPLECTMVNAALLNEQQKSYSLEYCAAVEGIRLKETSLYDYMSAKFGGPPDKKQMQNFWRLPADDPWAIDYSKGDGQSTYQLWQRQQPKLEEQGLQRIHSIECRLINTILRCERKGVKIDEERLHQLKGEIEEKTKIALKNIDNINARSPIQVRQFLEKNGITNWPTTEKGNPQLNEAFLENSEPGRNIILVRKFSNLVNSFINPLIDTHIFNGRVHSTFWQTATDDFGTITGRFSSSDPNLQQVPKRNKVLGRLFRSVFIPDEHMIWMSGDMSQCEYRLFAHFSRSKKLIDGYNATPSIDMHSMVANMLGVERDPTAKRLNLAQLYGQGVRSLADTLGIPYEEAQRYVTQYHEEVPEARTFLRDAEGKAKERGYVMTLLKRRRRFPDSRFAHKAGNSIIQGSNADIIKQKMIEVEDYIMANDAGDLLFSVHDSLENQVWDNHPKIVKDITNIMTDFGPNSAIPLRVKMGVDVGCGKNWAIATYGEEKT